jgi:dihydrofolate reductase
MASVVAGFSMSLDGFVADPSDAVGPLFDWYNNGDVEVQWPGNDMVTRTTAESAAYLQDIIGRAGAALVGRRTFDYTDGFGGSHPMGVPLFIVSHSVPDGWPRDDAPFTFVTDGVESAVAQAKAAANGKDVGVAGPNIAQQCLNAGLLDEVHIQLVPVLLGQGIRFFDNVQESPVMLEDPTVIEGRRVTHLCYRVRSDVGPNPRGGRAGA